MPELFDVACHFDDIPVVDAYTGLFAFNGQFSTFEETAINGSTERKRSLSVAPGVIVPARNVVTIFGENWIIGSGNTDGIYGRAIRKGYYLKRADELAVVRSPAQLLASAVGASMYVNRMYLKDTVNGVTDSQYDPFWEVYTGASEVTPRGYFISVAGLLLRIRTSHKELSGFNLAQSDELDTSTLKTLTVPVTPVYNPVTDTYSGTTASVSAVVFDAYKFYKYATVADPKVNSGDLTAIVAASVPAGQTVTMDGQKWKVASVQAELDAWALHLVRL